MDINQAITALRDNPEGVGFSMLSRICDDFFGAPRRNATSHRVYKMPWPGDPRVNIQNHQGMAKPYQVRQVIKALERLQEEELKDSG